MGHPTLAVTTLVAVLLVGGGVGSWLSGRLALRTAHFSLMGLLVMVGLWLIVWPSVSSSLLGSPTLYGFCLLPLALFIGMPFPLGLKRFTVRDGEQVALAWAVNGVATVGGSIGATALATVYGHQSVLLVGAAFYGVSLLYAYRFQHI